MPVISREITRVTRVGLLSLVDAAVYRVVDDFVQTASRYDSLALLQMPQLPVGEYVIVLSMFFLYLTPRKIYG